MNRSGFLGALAKVLDRAVEADRASFGNIHGVIPGRGVLEILVQRGFDESFLKSFKFVTANDESPCGRAFRLRQRVVIADVRSDPWLGAYALVATRAGYCAVQSTPILSNSGEPLGVLSTYFRETHHLTRYAADLLDECARMASGIMMEFDGHQIAAV